jgi:hypothetical protein
MTYRSGKKPSVLFKGHKIGTIKSITYEGTVEEQYPHDMLYHPSPAMKRLEKMIEKEDYNPSRRKQRKLDEILDDTDLDKINTLIGLRYEDISNAIRKLRKKGFLPTVIV